MFRIRLFRRRVERAVDFLVTGCAHSLSAPEPAKAENSFNAIVASQTCRALVEKERVEERTANIKGGRSSREYFVLSVGLKECGCDVWGVGLF